MSGGGAGVLQRRPGDGAAASGPRRRLCFPGRYYEYIFGHSWRRTWGRRPLAARAEPELLQLQVVIEAGDPGCDRHPQLASSEACEYPLAAPLLPRLRQHRYALAFLSRVQCRSQQVLGWFF